jgi:hypothetical protein
MRFQYSVALVYAIRLGGGGSKAIIVCKPYGESFYGPHGLVTGKSEILICNISCINKRKLDRRAPGVGRKARLTKLN